MNDLHYLHQQLNENINELKQFDRPSVWLVEDDQVFGSMIKKYLEKKYEVSVYLFSTPHAVLDHVDQLDNSPPSFCLVTDISFDEKGMDGLSLIDLLKERQLTFEAIVMTGFASIESAISATKKGVYHYLTKPFDLEILAELIQKIFTEKFGLKDLPKTTESQFSRILTQSQTAIEAPTDEDICFGMIGRSKIMKKVFERIKKVASSGSTVLIGGASGTGKELVARAIHQLSQRSSNPMISVNCGAIPSELLESELFGHEKGAFTGAITSRKGRFELAHKGTIFLDEIGDMPLILQVKLLRVLQNKTIERVGATNTQDVDVRIITATHRDLETLVSKGDFREDLYYRLNVIPVRLPALKERREDIPLLISYFLSRFVSADKRNNISFTDKVINLLVQYDWPGNVRELENLIERLVILKGGSTVDVEDLPAKFLSHQIYEDQYEQNFSLPETGLNLKQFLSEIEDSLIKQALEKTKGNKNQASKLLNLNRTTLIEKMKKKGMLDQHPFS